MNSNEYPNECIFKDFDFICYEPCKGKYCKHHKTKGELKEVIQSTGCKFTDYKTGNTCGIQSGHSTYCPKHVAFLNSRIIRNKK